MNRSPAKSVAVRITSAIDHRGRTYARLPWFTRANLEVRVTGRDGATPYMRFGDAAAVVAAAGLFGGALGFRLRRARAPARVAR